ncbi:MAG: hypothetical protein C0593_07070 [Marinilabiliales bacterium]|nr:MAG: hypothetical protein C0593_07070 [Marinilabiliales bacterium]
MAKRKKSRKRKKQQFNPMIILYLIIIFGIFFLLDNYTPGMFRSISPRYKNTPSVSASKDAVTRVKLNYGTEVKKYAAQMNLDPAYLQALIILETSGKKPPGKRFEKHVYHKLRQVKNGQRSAFEKITKADLHDATDDALRNLATSWGPFQIMGYKCIHMQISLGDLRGDKAVYYGIKWIDENYGSYLRKGKYRDAFHIHNTGHPYPKVGPPRTYDPAYVSNGLRYMKKF